MRLIERGGQPAVVEDFAVHDGDHLPSSLTNGW